MSRDQYTLSDPTKLYADIETHEQSQPGPGLDANLDDRADLGEQTYRGSRQQPEALPEFGEQTPLGRAGQPAELAPAFVYLASGESSYVTGATIHVNGGMPTP